MKINGNTVTYAILHGSIFVPNGAGTIGPTLGNQGDARNKAVKMQVSDDGLFLQVDTGKHQIAIPMTNVTHMVLAPQPAKLVVPPEVKVTTLK